MAYVESNCHESHPIVSVNRRARSRPDAATSLVRPVGEFVLQRHAGSAPGPLDGGSVITMTWRVRDGRTWLARHKRQRR